MKSTTSALVAPDHESVASFVGPSVAFRKPMPHRLSTQVSSVFFHHDAAKKIPYWETLGLNAKFVEGNKESFIVKKWTEGL